DETVKKLAQENSDLRTQLAQMKADLAEAKANTPPPMADDSTALQAKVVELEARIAKLTAKTKSTASKPKKTAAPATKKKSASHKTSRPSTAPRTLDSQGPDAQARGSQAENIAPRQNRSWILRSATRTEAWVARDIDTTQLQRVQVGDTLPGIGRITAIQRDDKRWVVQGTQGAIR
ncbi:MAG: hypothetical protein EBZ69_04675, partial [Alphaproteobacteria bacterium]|nr:hypothetical protein [Alphaproteobacteria bacterium]